MLIWCSVSCAYTSGIFSRLHLESAQIDMSGSHGSCCMLLSNAVQRHGPTCLSTSATPLPLQAVIGAGAAGLVSIRELLREGHHVVGFEQSPAPGGVWVYDTATDSDLLGAQLHRRRVHGSMYRWDLVAFQQLLGTMLCMLSLQRQRLPAGCYA